MTTVKKYESPATDTKDDVNVTPADVKDRHEDAEYTAWKNQKAADQRKTEQAEKAREDGEYADVIERLKYESSGETVNDPNGGNIVFIQNNVPDGQGGIKEIVHGPMPRGEWAEYSRKRGL